MKKKVRLAAFVVSLGVACTPAAAAYTEHFLRSATACRTPGTSSPEDGGQGPAPPYVDGHFSNGPTWVEDLYRKC